MDAVRNHQPEKSTDRPVVAVHLLAPTEDLSTPTNTGMRTIKLNYAKTTFPRKMYWKLEFLYVFFCLMCL